MAGLPLLLLTTTGAKTGRALTKPLAYTKDGGRIFVIASFAGSPNNPAWFNNLVANPTVTVEWATNGGCQRASITLAERFRRARNRLDSPRVSGSRRHLQRAPSAPRPLVVRRLLPTNPHPSYRSTRTAQTRARSSHPGSEESSPSRKSLA